MTDKVVIGKDELFGPAIDEALARRRALSGARAPQEEITPLRRLLLSSTFYLPVAGALASLLVWILLEPGFHDVMLVSGPVTLVNASPVEFAGGDEEFVTFTIGPKEVLAPRGQTFLEPATGGRPAFASLEEIRPGTEVEVAADEDSADGPRVVAMAIRPRDLADEGAPPEATGTQFEASKILLFPMTAVAIALALVLAEGAASRNWLRAAERGAIAMALTLVFSFLAFLPAGLCVTAGQLFAQEEGTYTVHTIAGWRLFIFAAGRSAAWACIGTALGLGLNLVRSTKIQLRNSVLGGAMGGALGGAFFDPCGRFLTTDSAFTGAATSRLVGMVAVGACVGYFVALVDQLASEAWLRVKTGPLAGKAFVLFRTPTTVGSSPRCDVYLFKDAAVEPEHAHIHRVGNRFEIEDRGGGAGTKVGGRAVRRHRLSSGDQIVLGATVLEFEERRKSEAGQPAGPG